MMLYFIYVLFIICINNMYIIYITYVYGTHILLFLNRDKSNPNKYKASLGLIHYYPLVTNN